MCNDAVQMNTSLNPVLVFILLLRHLLSRPYVRWNQAGNWSFSEKTEKKAPLNFATGEMIQDRAQQMKRWVEHDYSELSARENMVSLEALKP